MLGAQLLRDGRVIQRGLGPDPRGRDLEPSFVLDGNIIRACMERSFYSNYNSTVVNNPRVSKRKPHIMFISTAYDVRVGACDRKERGDVECMNDK